MNDLSTLEKTLSSFSKAQKKSTLILCNQLKRHHRVTLITPSMLSRHPIAIESYSKSQLELLSVYLTNPKHVQLVIDMIEAKPVQRKKKATKKPKMKVVKPSGRCGVNGHTLSVSTYTESVLESIPSLIKKIPNDVMHQQLILASKMAEYRHSKLNFSINEVDLTLLEDVPELLDEVRQVLRYRKSTAEFSKQLIESLVKYA